MTHPCADHVCDHCFICDHVGICCCRLAQAEKDALFAGGGVARTSALQARLGELRREWGSTSRLLARSRSRLVVDADEEPFDFGPPRGLGLPAMGNVGALPPPRPVRALPAPRPVIERLGEIGKQPASRDKKERYL